MRFVERHRLWDAARSQAAAEVIARIEAEGLDSIRLAFPDQHGILRGKTVLAGEIAGALQNGVSVTSTLLLKDTAHRTVFPVWSAGAGIGLREVEGAADFLLLPDPATFRVLPWVQGTGWMLCDAYYADGREVPFATRRLCRELLGRVAQAGYDMVVGLEVEFHLFRLLDAKEAPEHAGQPGEAPEVALLSQGYQYLTELRFDQMEPALDVLRHHLTALGLKLRSMEVEYGPSQVEFTFRAGDAMQAADDMVLFRSAAKQIARRHGYHATFMCRPRIPNAMSSGWHLHQSLSPRAGGGNAFVPEGKEALSPLGMRWLGGLLAEARAAAAFTTPTINGYKRYRPHSLAPDRAIWGRDNRGAMLRVLGGPGDAATRIENRVGEPAANPYLYVGVQAACGLAGLEEGLDPGPCADAPYETEAPALPATLAEALDALDVSGRLRAAFGDAFVEYWLRLKRAEIARFNLDVSEWEQREYFSLF